MRARWREQSRHPLRDRPDHAGLRGIPATCWIRCSAAAPRDVTEENLQARLRGVTLMALSNKWGALVLTTGNKSELAVGYCTLYGDMCGGLAVISDVPKTLVYELARVANRRHPGRDSGERVREAALGRTAAGPEGQRFPARLRRAGPHPARLRGGVPDRERSPQSCSSRWNWSATSSTKWTATSTSASRPRPG